MTKGIFAVIDGLDGTGKGVITDTWILEAISEGKRVFQVDNFWKKNNYHPSLKSILGKFDILITYEPTNVGPGRFLRKEMIAKNGREYSAKATAMAYALDRQILYENLLLPILEAGIDVYQSRSFSTSMIYQVEQAKKRNETLDLKEILTLPGNDFCSRQENLMDYLIIPTISNVDEAITRTEEREKQDNCIFENRNFQSDLNSHYKSKWFREWFESRGVIVKEIDVSGEIEFTQEQAKEFYYEHLGKEAKQTHR